MAKLIDNVSGNVSQGIIIENVADSYKLSFNCSSIGNGNSFIRIYATLSDTSYKTYFFPIQFLNENEIEFSLDGSTTFVQFDMIGDANVSGITLEEVTNATMEYVKANSTYWDRIKDITSNTGKVRADMMEGIINMAVNAFSNESGTVTQENGVYTFLNGTTVEDSTEAVRICGGAIEVANSKKEDGSWNWTTAITGAGINAQTIIAETFAAMIISGATINGGTITSGTLSSCAIRGGTLYIGNNVPADSNIGNFTGVEITITGVINGYKNGNLTYTLNHSDEGKLRLRDCDSSNYLLLDSAQSVLYSSSKNLKLSGGLPGDVNSYIEIEENGGDIYITPNMGKGTVHIVGNLQVDGTIDHG